MKAWFKTTSSFPSKKPRIPKYIIALLNPYFPDIISAFQFFEIFARHDIDLLNQIKDKGNFSNCLFVSESKNSSTGHLPVSSV